MKTYQLTKQNLEEFANVFGRAIYLKNGWDEPTVVLLDSVGDCEAFYQKLKNPNEVENKLVESETINQLADDFWASNGQKYNWNFFANKVNYTEDNLVRQ